MRRLLALALLLPLGWLGACDDGPAQPLRATATWVRLPDPPLKPTLNPVTAWTRTELLVIGGDPAEWCPVDGDCAGPPRYATAGAAYSTTSGTWRVLADAPEGIPDLADHALVGDRLYVRAGNRLLCYDVRADTWSRVPAPRLTTGHQLTMAGRRLVFTHVSDEKGERPDLTYDTVNGRWSGLPDDPLGSTFDRSIVATPRGWVLSALVLEMTPGADGMSPLVQARYDVRERHWTTLRGIDVPRPGRWTWTGTRLVLASLGDGDSYPGGATRLDPVTGRSAEVDGPAGPSKGWRIELEHGPWVMGGGWLYDDRTGRWRTVPRPSGAAVRPGPAVWADGRIFVVGGVTAPENGSPQLVKQVWISVSALTATENLF